MRPPHLEWPLYRWVRVVLELGGAFTLFAAFSYVVVWQQFETFAKVVVPVLATYIATSGLFYNRARALPRGPSKVRSLYAGERSTQATLFTIVGVGIGCVLFGWGQWFGVFGEGVRGKESPWLFVYMPAFVFVMYGYSSFLFGLRVVSKEFVRPLHAREISKRIKNAP